MADIVEQLELLREHEDRVAMATLLAARGGSPRPVGSKLFVGEGGRLLGSVSIGGCVDTRVIEEGERVLRTGDAVAVTVMVDDAEALEMGLVCGASFDVLVERVELNAASPAMSVYRAARDASHEGRVSLVVTELEKPFDPAAFADDHV